MVVTITHLATAVDATDLSSYTTASISPSINQLVLAWVTGFASGGSNAPTLSGNGLTWVQVNTRAQGSIARTTLFRAMGSSPTSGVVTIDFGGQTQQDSGWSIAEFNNVDTGGADGADAIVQSAENGVTLATNLTVTLAAFADANNATAGGFGATTGVPGDLSVGAGFTEISRAGGGGARSIISEWRDDNDTSVDASKSGGSVTWIGIAVEIKAGALDTEDKRRSGITPNTHVLMPLPDGTIAALDRQQAAWIYSGIAAAGGPTNVLISQYRQKFRGVMSRVWSRVN